MAPAATAVKDMLEDTAIDFPGLFACVSNVSARPFTSAAQIRELLSRQCVDTVRWWESVRWLDQEDAVTRWVGIGPGKVGRNLVGKEVGMRGADMVRGGGVWGISSPKEIETVLRELVRTRLSNHPDSVYDMLRGMRLSLPLYWPQVYAQKSVLILRSGLGRD